MADRLETVQQALAWGRNALGNVRGAEPLDAAILLAAVLDCDRVALLTHPERRLDAAQRARYRSLVRRRASGTPVAYLTGSHPFFDLELTVTPDVLIPRPETEHLVEAALAWAGGRAPELRVVDVGTGSGALAVTLAKHLTGARVMALDCSRAALHVARQNARRYDLGARVCCVQGDLLAPLARRGVFDLIVANLPYVAHDELAALPVAQHEPRLALDGGPDGLDVIRRLLRQAPERLAPVGLLLLEIGAGQGERVAALARAAFPEACITIQTDYAGHDRVVRVERGSP